MNLTTMMTFTEHLYQLMQFFWLKLSHFLSLKISGKRREKMVLWRWLSKWKLMILFPMLKLLNKSRRKLRKRTKWVNKRIASQPNKPKLINLSARKLKLQSRCWKWSRRLSSSRKMRIPMVTSTWFSQWATWDAEITDFHSAPGSRQSWKLVKF